MLSANFNRAFFLGEMMPLLEFHLSFARTFKDYRWIKPLTNFILRSLRGSRHVVQSDRNKLAKSFSHLAFWRKYNPSELLQEMTLPLMGEIIAGFNKSVDPGPLKGSPSHYAHVLETTQPLCWIAKPCAHDHFHTPALGRAIVSHLPAKQQACLMAEVGADRPPRKCSEARTRLELVLAGTRAPEKVFEEEKTFDGMACFATPLALAGEPLAVISISVPVHRFPEKCRTALTLAGQQIAQPAVLTSG